MGMGTGTPLQLPLPGEIILVPVPSPPTIRRSKVKKMSLKVGLCTINSERATNQILERFKITRYFDAVVSRDKVRYVKPNSEHLEATLKALGVSAKEALLIGDGVRDMQCASDLKVIAVGLSAGVSSGKELTSYGANYLITSIADLPMLIEQINGSAGSQDLILH